MQDDNYIRGIVMPKQLHTYKEISANNTSNGNVVNVK